MRFGIAVATAAAAAIPLFAGPLASGATALEDPIVTRQTVMKSVSAATKYAVQMVKGEAPYDAAKAELAFRTYFTAAAAYGHLFPEGSDQGKTRASPKIWENMEDFQRRIAKLESDALANLEAATSGPDGLKTAVAAVTQNCQGCHELYRLEEH
jgi:cytochrome c556